ncbi:MAG: DUF4340 domain-containing protein [Kiritimatiellae bacterium]|nr:DUF4340 domain-containing protein [Kiritimatiellia bacterium]
MNNLRATVFLCAGIAVISCALYVLSFRARAVATATTRNSLCTFALDDVKSFDVVRGGTNLVALTRGDDGAWRIIAPYAAPADEAVVRRLVDAVTLLPLGDMRTEEELAALHEDLADFGLAGDVRATVTLRSNSSAVSISFGAPTASGKEVYARTSGLRNVFTVANAAFDAVPLDADGFRRRALVASDAKDVTGIDLRVPESPFVKLVRGAGGWRLAAPVEAPADAAAVEKLVAGLAEAKVAEFVLPSASNPPPGGESAIKPSALAPYGLSSDAGFAVTVRAASGAAEQIVFGAHRGTNLVYALVQNGTAVVAVDAALAELCRAGGASFRDSRVFPIGAGERLASVSLTAGSLVYVLAQGTNGVWRLEAPVVAQADPAAAAAMVDRVLRMRRSDVPDSPPDKDGVRVSVATSAGVQPGVVVPAAFFEGCGAFADLRSKTLLALDPASVRRISVTPKGAAGITVAPSADRSKWNIEGGPPATVSVDAVKKLLTALTRVDAAAVETVAATPDDLRRCGLDVPELTIAIDFEQADSTRRNLLLGGVAAGGGRYATVGGADAVFILSRAVVQELTVKIAE